MNKQELLELIATQVCEVVPGLEQHIFSASDVLEDLGANSMERTEIIMLVLENLSLKIPLVELHGSHNMGELADFLRAKIG